MKNIESEKRGEKIGRGIIFVGIVLALFCFIVFIVQLYNESETFWEPHKIPRSVSTAD